MERTAQQKHWDTVYATKSETETSWYEQEPGLSLQLVAEAAAPETTTIIDVGAGASHLVDGLVRRGGYEVTALDVSDVGLNVARSRLGAEASAVRWIVGDITAWVPDRIYDIWHDRAAFHFLTDPADRAAYVRAMSSALKPRGTAILGTFAPDGPEKCSGLPVMRHDAGSLQAELGPDFVLLTSRRTDHQTPWGSTQKFQFSTFRRL